MLILNMKDIKIKDLRQFGIVLGIILSVIGGIHLLKDHTRVYPWFFGVGIITVLAGSFVPQALKPVYVLFTKLTHAIGWFNTRVILILVYYLLLTPISLLMRLFKKDPLNRKFDQDEKSYWIRRVTVAATKESLERQF